MKKCEYCGTELNDGAKYCEWCGEKTEEEKSESVITSEEDKPKTKKCPFCAEEIQEAAIVCRWCGRELVPKSQIEKAIAGPEASTSKYKPGKYEPDTYIAQQMAGLTKKKKRKGGRSSWIYGLVVGILAGTFIYSYQLNLGIPLYHNFIDFLVSSAIWTVIATAVIALVRWLWNVFTSPGYKDE